MPELTYSLLSVSKAAERGVNLSFDDQKCLVTDANERLITIAPKVGKLQVTTIESEDRLCAVTDGVAVEELWHRRYGHRYGVDNLINCWQEMNLSKRLTIVCPCKNLPFCESCLEGKHRRSPFPLQIERMSLQPLELVHTDVCGKLSVKSLSGAEYFVTFIDDKTRYVCAKEEE